MERKFPDYGRTGSQLPDCRCGELLPLIHSKKIFFQSFLRSESEVFALRRKSALTVLDDERSFLAFRNLDPAHQFKDSNFRPRTEPDRETGGAYAAVDVELPAGFLEPSADVASFYSGEGDAAMDELELAAVGVPGQGQVDAQLSSTIKSVGIMAQKDVDHLRHY